MGTFLLLATEAHSAGEGGFGLNLNIFETNLINLAILVGVLVFFGAKSFGKILSERSAKVAEAIQEAETRQKKAAAALAEQQQKLAQAQAQAEKIRAEAKNNAQKAKEAILAQGVKDVEKLKAAAVQELDSEQAKVIAELKERIATLALKRVESELKSKLDSSAQTKLIDRSIAQLGGRS